MPKVTPSTDEQHDLVVLESIMSELKQEASDKILPMLEDQRFEIEPLRELALDVYKKTGTETYRKAVFNLLLLLTKYHPLNVFVPNSARMECPVTHKPIDPDTSVLTLQGTYLNYEAIWVDHKKLVSENPLDNVKFSEEEVAYQKSCIEHVENTRAYSTVAPFLGQVVGALAFDLSLSMWQQDSDSDNAANNLLLYASLAFAGAKLGEKVGYKIWDKYCRTSGAEEEKMSKQDVVSERSARVLSRIKGMKTQLKERSDVVIDVFPDDQKCSSVPATFFYRLLRVAKTMTAAHGHQSSTRFGKTN